VGCISSVLHFTRCCTYPSAVRVTAHAQRMINSGSAAVAQPAQNTGGEMFDFRRATLFRLGYRLSKHKMTRYANNFGGSMAHWVPCLRLARLVVRRQVLLLMWTTKNTGPLSVKSQRKVINHAEGTHRKRGWCPGLSLTSPVRDFSVWLIIFTVTFQSFLFRQIQVDV